MKSTLALFVVVLASVSALAQAPAGIVTTLDGPATVTRRSQATPIPLKLKDFLFIGDRIATARESLLKVVVGGKALLTIREVSTVAIYDTPGSATIALESGKLRLIMLKERMAPAEVWEVRTRNAVVDVRVAAVIVEVEPRDPVVTNICVIDGTVSASAVGGAPVDVGPGQSVTITGAVPGATLSPPSPCRTGVMSGLQGRATRGQGQKPGALGEKSLE